MLKFVVYYGYVNPDGVVNGLAVQVQAPELEEAIKEARRVIEDSPAYEYHKDAGNRLRIDAIRRI